MFLVLEERVIAHGRRVGTQLRQSRKQDGTLQQHVNQADLLWLKRLGLDEKRSDNAHGHPDIGGYRSLDALSRYDTHDYAFTSLVSFSLMESVSRFS